MFPRPREAKSLGKYKVWIRFADGAEGTVDLAHLKEQGVFQAWEAPGFFDRVFVSAESGTVTWPGELDLDPDVLYAQATGRSIPGADAAA